MSIFIGLLYFYEFIIFTKVDGNQTVLPYIGKIHYGGLLYDTFSRDHEKILAFFEFLDRDDGRDLFFRLKLEEVDDRSTSCGPSCLRYLICLQHICTTPVGEEHDMVMGRGHEKIFDKIIIDSGHSLDTLAAAPLGTEIIYSHSLDVSETGHGKNCIFKWYKLLITDF